MTQDLSTPIAVLLNKVNISTSEFIMITEKQAAIDIFFLALIMIFTIICTMGYWYVISKYREWFKKIELIEAAVVVAIFLSVICLGIIIKNCWDIVTAIQNPIFHVTNQIFDNR